MTTVLVLHDLGAPGGTEWSDAFRGWPGPVLAPDLPGHDGAPPPEGGNHETGDAVYVVLELLRAGPPDDLLVVGVGRSGAAAQILALGGRATGLVLVDGLGGSWLEADEIDARQRDMRRKILATPSALAVPEPGTPDPRATMVVGAHDRSFAVRQAEAMPVPVLVVETDRSPTPDADELTTHFPRAELQRAAAREPGPIAATVRSWWSTTQSSR